MVLKKYASEILAELLAATQYDDFPGPIVSKAKQAILDSFGCMIGGSTLQPGQIVLEMIASMGGRPEATVVSLRGRVPTPWAAYANAYLANLMDYDDTYGGLGHPGGPIIAAAFVMADQHHASGKDFISSVILGYEAAVRVGEAIKPTSDRAKRVSGQGTLFVFGAATAAGRLLGLNADQLADALTLAGTHSPVPAVRKFGYSARPLSWIKNNLGWASMGGVWASMLAHKGFHGNRSFFDGDTGFWLMASSDQWNRERIVTPFGTDYALAHLSFKPYTSCRYIHTTLDGLTEIIHKHGIVADKVNRVIIKSTKKAQDFADYSPQGPIDGQFSMPYVVAMTLLGIPPGYAWQMEESLTDPRVMELARKVTITEDQKAEKYWQDLRVVSTVGVELVDGCYYEESVVTPKGDPGNPLSNEELVEKFMALAEPVVGQTRAEELVRRMESLETLQDVSTLRDLLMPKNKRG
jgi:2-methylcitrate dehydratase PrpD